MASKKTTTQHTRARAKEAAGSGAVRDRIREISAGAFRDGKLSRNDMSKLVHEVFDGAVEAVDTSIPRSARSVLREVFDGLSEGVHAIASAGSGAVNEVRERGRTIAGEDAPDAAKRIRAANDDFLAAVKTFAGKTSKNVREELDALVARAEKARPKVTNSARKAASAADGRLVELSQETARAGISVVRRAADGLAMGAGGLLEGLAEAISPRGASKVTARAKKAGGKTVATKKAATKKAETKKAATKKTSKKKAASAKKRG